MTKHILLAEDSADDAQIVRNAFVSTGINNSLHHVTDGEQTIAYLKGDGIYADRNKYPEPGILLLDLVMPGMDGFEVLEWIGNQPSFKHLLIVVLSGHNGLQEIGEAYRLGANSFLFKPCRPQDISHLLKSFPEYWSQLPFNRRLETDQSGAIPKEQPWWLQV